MDQDAAGLVAGLLFPALLPAADFPNRPINLIVPYAAGGSTDVVGRALAKVSAKHMPQPLVAVNQPGGAGITGRVAVVKAAPDGYTLLFGYGSGEDLVTPHVRKVPYDQFKDLAQIAQVTIVSIILVVPANQPAKSVKEWVAWAKAQRDAVIVAVGI